MPTTKEDLHGNALDKSDVALLLIDVINDLEFPEGGQLLRFALPMARQIAVLKRRARQENIPVVYVNDNFGRWRSDFSAQVEHCLQDGVRGKPVRTARSAAARMSSTSRLTRTGTCGCGRRENKVLPLHQDPHFTFRFSDDRIILRFHLEGVQAGRWASVFKVDLDTGERLGLLATGTVGEGRWVDLPEPIIVRAGEAFVAVPEPEPSADQ